MIQQHPKKSKSTPIYCLVLLSSIVVLLGCRGNSQLNERLIALDSLLIGHPDSVYHVLEGMKKEVSTQPKSSRMYYELLLADAQNKAYINFTTDSVMKIVAEYYDKHGNSNEQMRAHYLLGCTYRDLKDVPMELQCFQDAVEKADTTSNDCNWRQMASIYGQMADLYHFQYLPEEELKALSKCEIYDRLNNDNYAAIKSYELRLRAYYFKNMPDSVLTITYNARQKYLSIGDTASAAALLCPAISILIDKQEYKLAKQYQDIFEKQSGVMDKNGNIDKKKVIYLHDKGRIALQNNDITSAKNCFAELIKYNKKEAGYHGMMEVYQALNMPDSIAKYAKLFAAANDSSFMDTNAEIVVQMSAMYNYGHQSYIAELNAKAAKKAHQRLYLYIGLSVLVIILIIYCSLCIKRTKENEIIEMTKSYFDLLSQKDSLEKEIYSLTTSSALLAESNRKVIEQKEKELLALKHLVDYYSGRLELNDFSKRLEAFKNTSIFSRLKQSIVYKNDANKLTETEWRKYESLLEQYFPRYYKCITSNSLLNHDEKRVCLLQILGFSPKELSFILNKTKPRISNIRASINKKMFNVDSAINLDENLKRLF